ncbi:MAG: DnaJ domain-containing protein [Cyclobacteriaceae bacterium]|nr:DnaJ domain-containing protein [Cyclobacteriaceae bacterium]
MFTNYYEILGLSKNCSRGELKKSYRELAKKYHPDLHKGNPVYEEKFKLISEAYNTLSSQEKRQSYDLRYEYFYYTSTNTQNETFKPSYKKRPYYSVKKKKYNPFVLMYGKIFVIFLIMLVILIPLGLFYKSSLVFYEKGQKYELEKDYKNAVDNYKNSVTRWGARNFEASVKIGLLSIKYLRKFNQADHYFEYAIDIVNNDSIKTWLLYKSAYTKSQLFNFEDALNTLKLAEEKNFFKDSIYLLKSEIHAYKVKDFKLAKEDFLYLIDHEIDLPYSWFGLGWTEHNLFNYEEALNAYDKAIELDRDFAQAYLYKGVTYYNLQDTLKCCQNANKAQSMGNLQAKEIYNNYCIEFMKTPHQE